MMARYASIILALALIACGTGVTPPGEADPPSDGGADTGATVSFTADIQPIFDTSCTGSCHVAGGAASFLPLAGGVSHANLVGQPSTQTAGGGTLVVPGDPAASILLRRLSEDTTGDPRMPGGGAAPLADAQISAVTTWIDEGGLDN